MAVELDGNVRMRGDIGPGVAVRVLADRGRIRLVSGNELVGDWAVSEIGVNALDEGFNIKAEGEEFVLRTDDDVAFAEEIGVAAAAPRLARRLASRHNPEERALPEEPPPVPTNLGAIGLAVAGALILLGGTFLNMGDGVEPNAFAGDPETNGFEFWLAFIIGGVLMIGIGYVMSIGMRIARGIAIVVVVALIAVFGYAVAGNEADNSRVMAYGFIAGGLVVGVTVLSSGSLRQPD
ncbi:MAG: hypothetical protein ACRDU9_01780 [Acidimicrobiia bacterium]